MRNFQTVATVWLYERRPDITLMIDLIRSRKFNLNGGQYKALSGYLESIGLIKNGSINAEGMKVLETGMAWIPEMGRYQFSIIEDALMGPEPILIGFERLGPDQGNGNDQQTIDLDNFYVVEDRPYESWVGESTRFRVSFKDLWEEKAPRISWNGAVEASAEITIDDEATSLQIISDRSGKYSFKKLIQKYDNLNENATIKGLLPDYDLKAKMLRVGYDQIKDRQELIDTMKRNFDGKDLAAKTIVLNSMDDTDEYEISVKDVIISPDQIDDAMGLLSRSVPGRDAVRVGLRHT